MEDAPTRRTYKRETAIGMLLFLGSLFVWGVGWGNANALHSAEFLTTFTFLFAAGAFGVEAASQFKKATQ